jgi:hypothetical protein
MDSVRPRVKLIGWLQTFADNPHATRHPWLGRIDSALLGILSHGCVVQVNSNLLDVFESDIGDEKAKKLVNGLSGNVGRLNANGLGAETTKMKRCTSAGRHPAGTHGSNT